MVFCLKFIKMQFCTTGTIMHSTVIFGCGNLIMGDDGFGPAVIEELKENYQLPESATPLMR